MNKPILALVDCNSFFASCERVFNPKIRHKPVVVLSNNDGCVVARSKEAKLIGIPMGAPAFKFRGFFKEHDVQVFSSNYVLYADISKRIMTILNDFSPRVEQYSIDEAFIDLSNIHNDNLEDFARTIRKTILKWTGVPVSIGIAHTKTLTKIANEISKKNESFEGVLDLTKLSEEEINEHLKSVEVGNVWGIGRQSSMQLRKIGINTALKLKYLDPRIANKKLSIVGERLVRELNNYSCIKFDDNNIPKKTIASTRSFKYEIKDYRVLSEAVCSYTANIGEKLRGQKSVASFIQVFILTNRFKENSPQYRNSFFTKIPFPTSHTPTLTKYALSCLERIFKKGYSYKKAGVIVSGILPENYVQYDFFEGEQDKIRDNQIQQMAYIDGINKKWGDRTIKLASEGIKKEWYMRQDLKSKRFTTCWEEIPVVK